jgi:hypothetical protein
MKIQLLSLCSTVRGCNTRCGKLDIPTEHRDAAKDHIDSEMNIWFGNDEEDKQTEIERSRAKARIEVAKATF